MLVGLQGLLRACLGICTGSFLHVGPLMLGPVQTTLTHLVFVGVVSTM